MAESTEVKDFKDGGDDLKSPSLTPSLVRSNTKLEYSRLPGDVQEVLKAFDTDGSGAVDLSELAGAAQAYKQSRDTAAQQQRVIVVILGILLLTIGAITGLTFAMMCVGPAARRRRAAARDPPPPGPTDPRPARRRRAVVASRRAARWPRRAR